MCTAPDQSQQLSKISLLRKTDAQMKQALKHLTVTDLLSWGH